DVTRHQQKMNPKAGREQPEQRHSDGQEQEVHRRLEQHKRIRSTWPRARRALRRSWAVARARYGWVSCQERLELRGQPSGELLAAVEIQVAVVEEVRAIRQSPQR